MKGNEKKDKNSAKEAIVDTAQTRYLNPDELQFNKTAGGFLSLSVKSLKKRKAEVYPRIHLYWAFPFSRDREYISVRDKEDKEIGIIETLDAYNNETLDMLEEELASRYFTPGILKVISVKEEFGYSYWDSETTAGRCRFTIQSSGNSAVPLSNHHIIIIDVDGNRFKIDDYRTLPPKAVRVIETLL